MNWRPAVRRLPHAFLSSSHHLTSRHTTIMDPARKRPGSSTLSSKKRSKKSHFQTVRVEESTSVASSDSESVASAAQEVTVNNFNYHSTTANGRLKHRSTRRRVAPHPAEGIFSKAPAPCSDDLELASVLEAFPAEDAPSTDNPSDNAGTSRAKRARADLKAAVQCILRFHSVKHH